MTRFFLSYHSRLGYRVNVPNFEGGHCITVDEHDSELAALRQRIAELEAAQSVLKPRQCCAKCQQRAEDVREAAEKIASNEVRELEHKGGNALTAARGMAKRIMYAIRAIPLPPCADCNPLAPEA